MRLKKSLRRLKKSPRSKKGPLVLLLLLIITLIVIVLSRQGIRFTFSSKDLVNPLGAFSQEEKFKEKLRQYGFEVKEAIFGEDHVQITLGDKTIIFFSLKRDLTSQVASLQFVLSRNKIEGRKPSIIDLRFEKPVLKFSN